MAGVSDEFDDDLKQFTTSQILDAASEGAAKNINARIITELRISKASFPGREFDMAGANFDGRMRIYLVGKRKFVIGNGARFNESTKRFLDSFEFSV